VQNTCCSLVIIGSASVVCIAESVKWYSVCLSVYPAAGGLLLWARRPGDIDLLCLSVCLSQHEPTAANPLLEVCCCGPGGQEILIYCVCLSVPTWAHSSKPAAGGLPLWARRPGDVDLLCLSVCPNMGPQQQTRCWRFAAAGWRYRSIAAAAAGK